MKQNKFTYILFVLSFALAGISVDAQTLEISGEFVVSNGKFVEKDSLEVYLNKFKYKTILINIVKKKRIKKHSL